MFAGNAMAKPQEILKSQGPSIKDVGNLEGEGSNFIEVFQKKKKMLGGGGVKKLEKNCRHLLWMVPEMTSEASFKAWEAFFSPSAAITLA